MKNIIIVASFIVFTFGISSCKELVDVEGPETSISSKNTFSNNATAIGAVSSLYSDLSSGDLFGPGEFTSLSCIASLSADELTYYSLGGNSLLSAYYRNALTSQNGGGLADYWSIAYQRIYTVNSALEGLSSSNELTPFVKQQLIGELKFMRAFYYFYLVNLYGDVPVVITSDYKENALIAKSPRELVYKQIIEDLIDARAILSDKYLKGDLINSYGIGTEERVRPTRWAATALLARTFLYLKDWTNAEIYSTEVINNTVQFGLLDGDKINEVFLKNSKEAIWQLQPVKSGFNTNDGNIFILPSGGPSFRNPVSLDDKLVSSFNSNDLRKLNWIGSVFANGKIYYYPFKYKVVGSSDSTDPVIEYNTVLRFSEQFLIRSEAKANLGDLDGAIMDLDRIRKRAGLLPIKDTNPNIGKEELIIATLIEKQHEFFTEWGHRWLDLKRSGTVNEVMAAETPKKAIGSSWKNYQQDYPIPQFELQSNPNLVQVKGY